MYLETKSVRQVENFNLDWFFCHTDCDFTPGEPPTKDFRPVKLPHDWSLEYPLMKMQIPVVPVGMWKQG